MASKRAVTLALAALAENFGGEVTPEKGKLWLAALTDVEDAALESAVGKVIRSHTGNFIPPVALIREATGVNRRRVVDSAALLRLIERIPQDYNAAIGWQAPRVDTVRERLGPEAARAYAAAGAARLFSGNEVSRDIALREFQKELDAGTELPAIGGEAPKALPA